MWRAVAFLVLAVIYADSSLADSKHGILLQRLKRSPYYCPPNYQPPQPYWPPPHWHHHHHWPPPPPPPPQGYYDQPNQAYSASQAQASAASGARSGALTHGEPGEPGGSSGPGGSGGPSGSGGSSGPGGSGVSRAQGGSGSPPCDKCNNGPNSAVSNAQSDTGDAIAVAIARGKSN